MKTLLVKEWFHVKKMNEKKKDVQKLEVFAILKETEKAYNVFVGDTRYSMTYWVPKSCTEWTEDLDDGINHIETIYNDNYQEVYAAWNERMSNYR